MPDAALPLRQQLRYNQDARELRLVVHKRPRGFHDVTEYRVTGRDGLVLRSGFADFDGEPVDGALGDSGRLVSRGGLVITLQDHPAYFEVRGCTGSASLCEGCAAFAGMTA
jgi:hypothetical protein